MQMLAHTNEMTAFAQGSRPDGVRIRSNVSGVDNADLNEVTKAVASTVKHAPRCGEKLAVRRQLPEQTQSEMFSH
jgi:hypothetical protein